MMKKLFSLASLLILALTLGAQVVTSDPPLPTESSMVTIYYDANQGSGNLAGYSGDVYAHTGVLTNLSEGTSSWRYVKTDWGENSDDTKLTRISADYYSLEITPSVREYYGVPSDEVITHMCFVFRSGDSSLEGKGDGYTDILVEVHEAGLSVGIIVPEKNEVVDAGSIVSFEAAAAEASLMTLYLNDVEIKSLTAVTSLEHDFTFSDPGDNWIRITAEGSEESAADSVFVHVKGSGTTGAVPEEMQDGINYNSETRATLVIYAPYKEDVFVIGDFNEWTPSSDYRMIQDTDADRFWLEISGLVPGEEYAFQYLIDGELLIADPYTEKTLDPNDRWISDATYPDLKSYPSGKTSGITSVLQTGQIPYDWQVDNFDAPAKTDLIIYELLIRDWIDAHDYKTLTDSLDYFTRLGINAIELMPINEFEGNESWGYNPSFYFAPDKYYGPAEDLKVFIDACHARGIAVIIDMVLNHSFGQSPLAQMYFASGKPTAQSPWYNVDSPNQSYYWGNDFNHEAQATKDFMDRVNTYWIEEFNVDGFRFDFTKGFTQTSGDGWAYDQSRINILKRMADVIWAADQDAYVILEHLTDNSEEKVLQAYGMMLWGNINYAYNEATMGWHDGGKSNFSGISYKSRGWSNPHLVGYMESHDEERLMYKNLKWGNSSGSYDITEQITALKRLQLAGAFFFTVPGPKMIWQFGELGYDYSINHCPDGSEDEDCRVSNKPIRWDYQDYWFRTNVYNAWAELIHLRNSQEAFSSDDFSISASSAGKRIQIDHSSMDVRIVGNFDVEPLSVSANFSQAGTWYDYFSGQELDVTDVNMSVELEPGEFRIYTTVKLEQPEFIVGIEEKETYADGSLHVYPNPVTDYLQLEGINTGAKLMLTDMNGRVLLHQSLQNKGTGLDLSGLKAGVYILVVENRGRIQHARVVKQD